MTALANADAAYHPPVHYYNDGNSEYQGQNSEKDYFLEGVTYANGTYQNGKMHMPDGFNYQVIFTQVDDNTLKAKMTVEGSPYIEVWKRTSITK